MAPAIGFLQVMAPEPPVAPNTRVLPLVSAGHWNRPGPRHGRYCLCRLHGSSLCSCRPLSYSGGAEAVVGPAIACCAESGLHCKLPLPLQALNYLDCPQALAQLLLAPRREIHVSLPITLDNGEIEVGGKHCSTALAHMAGRASLQSRLQGMLKTPLSKTAAACWAAILFRLMAVKAATSGLIAA